jgi:hypothetical protein
MEETNPITGERIVYKTPPEKSSIQYYLSRKAKDRGYGDKSEIDITTKGKEIGSNVQPTMIVVEGKPKSIQPMEVRGGLIEVDE